MTPEFDDWWDRDDLITEGNPYVDGTPAFWAWEGWCAGVEDEREACAKVCESYLSESPHSWGGTTTAAAIRARGNT
jgi:hypothetical protein